MEEITLNYRQREWLRLHGDRTKEDVEIYVSTENGVLVKNLFVWMGDGDGGQKRIFLPD